MLRAVRAELLESGVEGLTVDRVAQRSGVHRATVYRRWGDVGGLLADAVRAARDSAWTPPDTGSLAGDLTALAEEVVGAHQGRPTLAVALLAASFRSEAAATELNGFWSDRLGAAVAVVERARSRGEVPEGTDGEAVVLAVTGPLLQSVLLLGRPVAEPDVEGLAARVAAAAAAGLLG
ncbi:TetR-like C-terminal domain-containing protein [Kineococcus gynurae]|uniref:TetR-like C-terminal domain-containing protein n=1 Tax=Kineococcus gynurae TaxID=452979 RepID=A0ABV5LMU1_9ACTN